MSTRWVALVSVILLSAAVRSAATEERPTCLDSTLTFESSALERIVREPSRVLEDEDRFWDEEPAQKYTSAWAQGNGFTISRKKWRSRLSRFAKRSEEERLDSPLVHITEAVLESREAFLARALPHVCTFLPGTTDTGVPVYFTAFIPPRAFVTGGIVINVNAPYWKGNADNILNSLTHEIWHVGYSRLRNSRAEPPLDDLQLYGMLEQLQNEGTATYVAYQARSLFPAPDEVDFQMLDSPDEVTRALDRVNRLLRRVGTVSEKRLAEQSWEIGVDGRAYYIAGAHMARTIDGAGGRDALVRTLTTGPVSFVAAYNAVSSGDRRIEVPDAETISRRNAGSGFLIPVIVIAVVFLGLAVLWGMRRRTASNPTP